MTQYMRVPEIVNAVQYTGNNIEELIKFVGDDMNTQDYDRHEGEKWARLFIKPCETWVELFIGDYLIKNTEGKYRVMCEAVFTCRYVQIRKWY